MKPTPSRRQWLTGAAAIALVDALRSGTLAQLVLPPAHAQTPTSPTSSTSRRRWQNFSGIESCTPAVWATPANEAEVQQLMRNARGQVRPVGSGHSWSGVVPTDDTLVSLDRLAGITHINREAMTVTVGAGTRITTLSRLLDAQGLAIRNQPDIDVQTLAGAFATGTHGTGQQLPALHADVVGLRLVKRDGEVLDIRADRDPDTLAAAQVSLGSLGVITQLTLRVLPAFNLSRRVWVQPLDSLMQEAPKLVKQYRNFEFFAVPHTGYGAGISHEPYTGNDLVLPNPRDESVLEDLKMLRDWLSGFPSLRRWAAETFIDTSLVETSRHRSYRLLSSVRPTVINEAEWHVPADTALACLKEVMAKLETMSETFFPVQFRYVRSDDAWLSPFYQRASCSIALHALVNEPWEYMNTDFAPIFLKYQGRPHWGKLHNLKEADFAKMYPRWADFQALRRRLDPQGGLLNAHLRQIFGNS